MRAALLLALALCTLRAEAQPVDYLIGQTYAPLPGGWATVSGGLLGGADAAYAVAVHRAAFDDRLLLTFDRLLGRDEAGSPFWVILDAVAVEPVPEGYFVALQTCQFDGAADAEIVAVVGMDDTEWLADVHAAWRANRATGRLEPAEADRVRCLNEGD